MSYADQWSKTEGRNPGIGRFPDGPHPCPGYRDEKNAYHACPTTVRYGPPNSKCDRCRPLAHAATRARLRATEMKKRLKRNKSVEIRSKTDGILVRP